MDCSRDDVDRDGLYLRPECVETADCLAGLPAWVDIGPGVVELPVELLDGQERLPDGGPVKLHRVVVLPVVVSAADILDGLPQLMDIAPLVDLTQMLAPSSPLVGGDGLIDVLVQCGNVWVVWVGGLEAIPLLG